MTTYDPATKQLGDSAKGELITRDRAVRELRAHGVPSGDHDEALAYACTDHQVGNVCRYSAERLLAWLGY